MCDIVKEIAIININKYPSETGTYTIYSNLTKSFPLFKDLIARQVEILDPEIFIFGNTFNFYKDTFGILDKHKLPESSNSYRCDCYLKVKKLFIDTYHPANTQIKREKYCNQIINAVNNWRSIF